MTSTNRKSLAFAAGIALVSLTCRSRCAVATDSNRSPALSPNRLTRLSPIRTGKNVRQFAFNGRRPTQEGEEEGRILTVPDQPLEISQTSEPPVAESTDNPVIVRDVVEEENRKVSPFRHRFDDIDRLLIKVTGPLLITFGIGPFMQSVDLFWVNRLGDALAVAGKSAADQIYNSAFWLFSFLPSVTATLVSKKHASGNKEEVQDAVCQALVLGCFIAFIGTSTMYFRPEKALQSIFKGDAPALAYAKPYLKIRAFSFLPMIASFVGFSALRGTLDFGTPTKLSFLALVVLLMLDPILIHKLKLGVSGSAMSFVATEWATAAIYMMVLRQRGLIRWSKLSKLPSWVSLKPLLKGGLALQLRSLALNVTMIMVSRIIQSIDDTGVAASAHALAMQTFQLGGIVLSALSLVAQTIIPNAMVARYDEEKGVVVGGAEYAKKVSNRLMLWGFVGGCAVGLVQILLLPVMLKSQPLVEVREAARIPALMASWFQGLNGLVFVGEGILMGSSSFWQLSINTSLGTLFYLASLRYFPQRFGLVGVWIGLVIFMLVRLAGIVFHQLQPFGKQDPTISNS